MKLTRTDFDTIMREVRTIFGPTWRSQFFTKDQCDALGRPFDPPCDMLRVTMAGLVIILVDDDGEWMMHPPDHDGKLPPARPGLTRMNSRITRMVLDWKDHLEDLSCDDMVQVPEVDLPRTPTREINNCLDESHYV